jgi:Fe(3+) dicitrate transport protein
MKSIIATFLVFVFISNVKSQLKDTVKSLAPVTIVGYKTINGVGHLMEIKDGIIYAGKKTEIIIADSLDANKAINNTRQILGRIPGLNIVEIETSGFTANGIATRGLNPIQSIEMNTRQNGYNVSADAYGYNEAYYLPPMEAINRIELVRGAASLQFGAQFGGLVNYVIKDAPANKPFEFTTSQTAGSFGLFNSFNSIGGHYKKISYYSFIQYRNLDGYRPNSRQWQLSGFGRLQYNATPKLNIGAEYSLLRNQLKMPGGLTDSLFNISSQISTRARNWLKSPWNIIAAYANYNPNANTSLLLKTTYLFSSRSLVWRNEDGGPQAIDEIDPATNTFAPREVGNENMNSSTTELRFSHNYKLGKQSSTIAGGIRFAYAWFKRQGGGEGSANSDFDLSITGDWGYNLDFTTANLAPFAENIFRIGDKFSITTGFRFEYINSTAKGYKIADSNKLMANQSRNRHFPLAGLGLEYKTAANINIYGNISQAYRPIDYSQLEPFGVAAIIDPNLKDASGFNTDFGYRGIIKNYFNFDISLFYLAYNKRIGEVIKTDASGNDYAFRTNTGNSVHKGIESYTEFNLLKCLNPKSKYGLSIFNSFAFIDARYTNGEFKGNRVETANKIINRAGVNFSTQKLSSTFQVNYTGDAYGDASNLKVSDNAIGGYIPAYTVLDFSATYKINKYAIKAGVSNIADASYFTRRTDEYPGPGIIPSIGRSFYIGLSAKF